MGNRGVIYLVVFLVFWVMALPTNLASAAITLESSYSLRQTYTDNLFYNDRDREDDFGTSIGPNFLLKYDNPDIVIGGIYTGRFIAFVNNPDQNRYIQNANILLDLPFLTKRYKQLSVTIDETMNLTPELDAFSLSGAQDTTNSGFGRGGSQYRGAGGTGDPFGGGGAGGSQGTGGTQGVFTSRASAFLNRAGITLAYAWTPRVTSSLIYNNQYRHFFSGDFQDSMTHTGTFSVAYGVKERTTLTPSYSYRQSDFLGKSTVDADTTSADKVISHRPQLEISYNFTPSLTGSIHGGVAFTKQINAQQSDGDTTTTLSDKWQTGGLGGVMITKLYQSGNISLRANQTIGSGGGLAAQAVRSRTITGRIQHSLSSKLSAMGSVGYARNESTEDGDAIDTTTYRIQAGIEYVFLSWLSGSLSYSRLDQNSSGSAAIDIKANQVFLGFTALADPWVLMR